MISVLSSLALIVLVGLCLTAIFAQAYQDNWCQFIGLSGFCIWGTGRLVDVLAGGTVTEMQVFAHVSLACFAVGTALKVVKHQNRFPFHFGEERRARSNR